MCRKVQPAIRMIPDCRAIPGHRRDTKAATPASFQAEHFAPHRRSRCFGGSNNRSRPGIIHELRIGAGSRVSANLCAPRQLPQDGRNNLEQLRLAVFRAARGAGLADQVVFSVAGGSLAAKLNGNRSSMSAPGPRWGNSARTWASKSCGSTPHALHVSMRL